MIRIVLACLLFCTAQAASANSPADYAYTFPIETNSTSDPAASSAWRIALTPEVYRWVHDADLGDIEVFNAAGQPVPVARIASESAITSQEKSARLRVLELPASTVSKNPTDLRLVIDRDADGRLRRIDAGEGAPGSRSTRDWLIDASDNQQAIDRLMLTWTEPQSGIVARFEIDASDDLETWRKAGAGTVLMLEQNGARLERHDIALADVRAKYLRLQRLDDGPTLDGLTVDAHSIEYGRTAPAREWIAADPVPATNETAPKGLTRFDYTIGASLPIDAVRVELASDNALAPSEVFARDDASWTRVGAITAFRLRQNDETLRNGDIDIRGGRRWRDFRIESPTPIAQAPHLSVGYRPDRFVFLAEGNGPFVLAAGSLRARHADYPVDAALASLRANFGKDWQPPVATLGAAHASAGGAALRAPPPPLPWQRWLLWAILIGGALVIAGFALSLLRGSKPGE